ncbi:protein-L-isoaspartate(D-aspartate) O-methyltransferase [bacterium]|nr:protein-L-isoaspartate(D-aspartate) O-methyltransferase [bacterium]
MSPSVWTKEDVINAMRRVPRHRFVPDESAHLAREDQPLPIGYGQTISQPTMVAIMTDLLQLYAGARVLEIGTGSGYQAALLAELGAEVYSVEIIPALAEQAAQTLQATGYGGHVQIRLGDGYHGWPEHAPYDAIIITAAAPSLPAPLVDQVDVGGRIIVPIGLPERRQHLWVYDKAPGGTLHAQKWGEVAFVPFTRE